MFAASSYAGFAMPEAAGNRVPAQHHRRPRHMQHRRPIASEQEIHDRLVAMSKPVSPWRSPMTRREKRVMAAKLAVAGACIIAVVLAIVIPAQNRATKAKEDAANKAEAATQAAAAAAEANFQAGGEA